jgi:predicted transcriptional regulator
MKNKKSLIRQLIESKRTNNEDEFESIHEEIYDSLESLCHSFTKEDITKETMTELSNILKDFSKRTLEFSEDL